MTCRRRSTSGSAWCGRETRHSRCPAADYPVDQASLLTPTPAGGLRAVTLRPQKPAGCAAADYGTKTVTGAIAVVDDTGCSIVDKQNTAVAEGAVGLLVVSDPGDGGQPEGAVHARATTAG